MNNSLLKRGLYLSLSALMCSSMFISCTKMNETDSTDSISMVANQESMESRADIMGSTFAKVLASALENPDMQAFIRDESNKRFDGDKNFLVAPLLESPQTKSTNGSAFYEMLKEYWPAPTKSATPGEIALEEFIQEVTQEDPLLQVYLMNEECWTNKDVMPAVVYLPENFDDQNPGFLWAYASNGLGNRINATNDYDDRCFVVVSRNERTLAVLNDAKSVVPNPNLGFEGIAFYSNGNFDYYLIEDVTFTPKSTLIGSGMEIAWDEDIPDSYTDSYRAKHPTYKDYIQKATIASKSAWKDLENVFQGDPEPYVNIIYGERSGGSRYIKSIYKFLGGDYGKKKDIKWCEHDIDVMQWSLSQNGKYIRYEWGEKDGNRLNVAEIEADFEFFGLQMLSGKVDVNLFNMDEEAGTSLVYYSDNNSTTYNTGWIKFTTEIR